MNTRCPACGFSHCYNSGFTIECWNKTCKFYTKAQFDAVQEILSKKKTPVNQSLFTITDEEEQRFVDAFDKAKSSHILPSIVRKINPPLSAANTPSSGSVNLKSSPNKGFPLYDDEGFPLLDKDGFHIYDDGTGRDNEYPDYSSFHNNRDDDDNA